MLKYIVELKKTPKMGKTKSTIYLKWIRYGIIHIVTNKEEATRYSALEVKRLKEKINPDRMIIHKEGE